MRKTLHTHTCLAHGHRQQCGEGQRSLGLGEVGSGGGRDGMGYICNGVNNEKVVLLKE